MWGHIKTFSVAALRVDFLIVLPLYFRLSLCRGFYRAILAHCNLIDSPQWRQQQEIVLCL